jgi:hypothetical protein
MDQWQRCAAARTRQLSLNSVWGTIGAIPIGYFGILTFVFIATGVWLRTKMPDAIPSPDMLRIVVADVQQWGGSKVGLSGGLILGAIAFLGLLCAAMSTVDSYVMTASQSFFVDVFNQKEGATLVEVDKKDSPDGDADEIEKTGQEAPSHTSSSVHHFHTSARYIARGVVFVSVRCLRTDLFFILVHVRFVTTIVRRIDGLGPAKRTGSSNDSRC